MSMFETRMTHSRLAFSPFTSENMQAIGQATLNHIKARIAEVKKVDDSQAKELTRAYKTAKTNGRRVAGSGLTKFKGLPIRDWKLRGLMLNSLVVKFASEYKCTIGPTSSRVAMLLTVRNRADQMWGMSPSDYQAMYNAVKEQMYAHKLLEIKKGSPTATAA